MSKYLFSLMFDMNETKFGDIVLILANFVFLEAGKQRNCICLLNTWFPYCFGKHYMTHFFKTIGHLTLSSGVYRDHKTSDKNNIP